MSILESDFNPQIIFLEKPACGNENELKILLNASNKKGVKVVLNHSRRFDKLHKVLKEKIQENSFGSLVKADVVYYSGWQHNGIHAVDTLHFLFDDELEFETLINSYESPYENDLNLDFKCRFRSNKSLVYLTTMSERYYQLFEFDLKFENARIRIEDFGSRLSYEKKTVNNMNEKVLVESNLFISHDSRSSAIQSAVKLLVDNLDGSTSLNGYLIKDIAKTMNTIWEGKKWTE
jgi:predicted dehydrogenase